MSFTLFPVLFILSLSSSDSVVPNVIFLYLTIEDHDIFPVYTFVFYCHEGQLRLEGTSGGL